MDDEQHGWCGVNLVMPEVLCVGFNKSFDFRIYVKSDDDRTFAAADANDKRFKEIFKREQTWYVVGPGSCHGDSGGPVFATFVNGTSVVRVLLGVTSSGTSKIGNCGGIDNPTHYTRLKKLRSFILSYVDDKQNLCFVDGHPTSATTTKTPKRKKKTRYGGSDYAMQNESNEKASPSVTSDEKMVKTNEKESARSKERDSIDLEKRRDDENAKKSSREFDNKSHRDEHSQRDETVSKSSRDTDEGSQGDNKSKRDELPRRGERLQSDERLQRDERSQHDELPRLGERLQSDDKSQRGERPQNDYKLQRDEIRSGEDETRARSDSNRRSIQKSISRKVTSKELTDIYA